MSFVLRYVKAGVVFPTNSVVRELRACADDPQAVRALADGLLVPAATAHATVYFPGPENGGPDLPIAEGDYTANQIFDLLCEFCHQPDTIRYIADMLEV